MWPRTMEKRIFMESFIVAFLFITSSWFSFSFLSSKGKPVVPVDASYGPWSSWSACNPACSAANASASQQVRNRTCTSPLPANGGPGCTGSESRVCQVPTCGGKACCCFFIEGSEPWSTPLGLEAFSKRNPMYVCVWKCRCLFKAYLQVAGFFQHNFRCQPESMLQARAGFLKARLGQFPD